MSSKTKQLARNSISFHFKKGIARLWKRARRSRSKEDSQLVSDLRRDLSNVSALPTSSIEYWSENRRRLHDLLMKQDPFTFLQFDVIRETMFVDSAPYLETELSALRQSSQWRTRWKDAIHETSIGSPNRCPFYLRSSGHLLHHAYCIMRFEKQIGTGIQDFDTVVEFGGGYGNMARLAHRLGFHGRYFIFDLPEFLALQRFYLRAHGIEVRDQAESEVSGVRGISHLDQLQRVVAGNHKSAVIATWSLSEAPLDLRAPFLSLTQDASAYLIGYQRAFAGTDNVRFFQEWITTRPELDWQNSELLHSPGDYLLTGINRGA